ncbi:MAG: BCD family MFS transporter [Chloroflexota bacterium]
MLRKIIQISFIHVAVAMTLVPINSTLNRVMIKELGISAALVSLLASLPYLFAPIQVMIGSYSDRHPILGWRRSPYIALGLLLCVAALGVAPFAVFTMPENPPAGLALTLLTFAAWGMGYNLAAVSYFSLASELTGEQGRSRTVAVMMTLMIISIIFTAATLSRLLVDYSPEQLQTAFLYVAGAALLLGVMGLFGLEPRHTQPSQNVPDEERTGWRSTLQVVFANPVARRFFFYLILMLAAILGQDVLLEPFAAQAFDLPVAATTRITSIWGTCMLITLASASLLERRMGKRRVAQIGGITAVVAFLLISLSAVLKTGAVFYGGVVLLGLGSGLATVSNLSLMLDMTTERVGLYIGAWGIANALSRLIGTLSSGVLRDLIGLLTGSPLAGYEMVFLLFAVSLSVSLFLLRRITVQGFQEHSRPLSFAERAAALND